VLLFDAQEGHPVPTNTEEYKDRNHTGEDWLWSAAFAASFVGLCVVGPMTVNDDIGCVVVRLPAMWHLDS